MPAKYHIHTHAAPPRERVIGKLGVVEWREDCSNCHNCVKRDCVYGFYRDEADTLREEIGFLDYVYQCKGCLTCVQNCTKGILTRVVNPEYLRIGDTYYKPDTILSTWYQAETGNIPVSGSGYGGPFSGAGFDSMWTDMSEIVRPTRDGIHGREYISVSVDIGRRLAHLAFEEGRLTSSSPPLFELPFPVIFDVVPDRFRRGAVVQAVAKAADVVGTIFVENTTPDSDAPIAMIPYGENVLDVLAEIKAKSPSRIVAVRLDAAPDAAQQVLRLTHAGVEVVHLVFDAHGLEHASSNPRHARDALRDVHRALIKDRARDQVTLIASGGIALAEHVAKAIICGADLVAIDLPLLIAMECRLCGECARGESCQILLEDIDESYAVQRIVNLMGAWHSQLLEMLGAMGIREVRRLRGETGRCMFFEDVEAATFGRMFGKRKDRV